MGYWSRDETELIINIEGREPGTALVYTNWSIYANKLRDCQGYSEGGAWQSPDGKWQIDGKVSIAPFKYIHLRSDLAASKHDEFKQRAAKLPEAKHEESLFRLGTGERETLIVACQDDPFWISICTDMLPWLQRLEKHQWACLVEEVHYAGAEDGGSAIQRTYLLPRALLQIRKVRPRVTEERRQALISRLGN